MYGPGLDGGPPYGPAAMGWPLAGPMSGRAGWLGGPAASGWDEGDDGWMRDWTPNVRGGIRSERSSPFVYGMLLGSYEAASPTSCACSLLATAC